MLPEYARKGVRGRRGKMKYERESEIEKDDANMGRSAHRPRSKGTKGETSSNSHIG